MSGYEWGIWYKGNVESPGWVYEKGTNPLSNQGMENIDRKIEQLAVKFKTKEDAQSYLSLWCDGQEEYMDMYDVRKT